MSHVGFACQLAFMYPNSQGYPAPPPGMPYILAELYLPKEEFWTLQGRIPPALFQFPRPPHYSYCSRAINTPVQPWTTERKIACRQGRLKAGFCNMYDMEGKSLEWERPK